MLGGTQSLHTNSLDEAYALPSEHAVTIALRTQQVIAYESGVPDVPDPLGGSYFVESLTAEVEKRANDYIRRIDEMGGMIPAIERGFPQTEIANASYEYQHTIETGEQKIVGVNAFVEAERRADRTSADRRSRRSSHQLDKLAKLKARARQPDRPEIAGCAAPRGRGQGKHHAVHPGRRSRLRHGRRNLRRLPRRLRLLYRNQRRIAVRQPAICARLEVYMGSHPGAGRQTGLDGHDRGAKVIARALRDAGMEVIYTGLRQTPEMIVNAALQEDVQVIGLSILSGAHNAIVPRVMELLREKDMDDVLVMVGGIIPDEDAAELKKLGVAAVFQPGASLEEIVDFIRSSVKQTA